MSIAGESASGKTTLVKNTAKACIKTDTDNAYTVICCDDYYKDASKELTAAGSYEELFKTGFSFDTPDAIDLNLMKEHLIKLKMARQFIPLITILLLARANLILLSKTGKNYTQ